MTLDEFAALTASRIPTPAEFVAFAVAQGWSIAVAPGGRASLRVPDPNDPVARRFARLLSREPYRTEVLKLVGVTLPPPPTEPAPEVDPAPPAADSEDGWACRVCARTFWVPESEVREFVDSPAFCDRSGAPEVRNRHTGAVTSPAAERCPYKSPGAV